jgi:protein TonB
MKRFLFLFLVVVFLSSAEASAQNVPDSIATVTNPDKKPEFKDGLRAWTFFLERNLDRDLLSKNGAPKGSYRVTASFVIDIDGSVKDIVIENDPGYGTAKEMKRIIGLSDKRWTTALLDNKPVAFRHKQSVTFLINMR